MRSTSHTSEVVHIPINLAIYEPVNIPEPAPLIQWWGQLVYDCSKGIVLSSCELEGRRDSTEQLHCPVVYVVCLRVCGHLSVLLQNDARHAMLSQDYRCTTDDSLKLFS